MRCALAVTVLALAGCGGQRNDLGTVSGTVTLNGEPVQDAYLEFVAEGQGGSTSFGRTDADGRYELMFTRDVAGASVGENRVRISTATVKDVDGEEVVIPERIPSQYNTHTQLVRTVEPGHNNFDFALDSKGPIARPRLADE